MVSFSPRARSRRTEIEGPPFIWERSSNANSGEISLTVDSSRMISLRNAALTPAAAVVPGRVL